MFTERISTIFAHTSNQIPKSSSVPESSSVPTDQPLPTGVTIQRRSLRANDSRLLAGTLLACVALSAVGCEDGVSDDKIEFASLVELREMRAELKSDPKAVIVIDSRSPSVFASQHISGARNYTLAEAPRNSSIDQRISGYSSIVVYGQDRGDSSAKGLAKRLMEVGYDSVYWFDEGMRAWLEAGGEVEGTNASPASKVN